MISVTIAFDVTAQFFSTVPGGFQLCGYTTGSGIAWTAAMWAAKPGSVRIDQDPAASDGTADILDVEGGAATFADCPHWVEKALANYSANTRPGQRKPAIYCSASNVTNVVNALIAGGVTSGVGLWIANWNLTEASAMAAVLASSGPFPVIGIQFTDMGGGGDYDIDAFSVEWLTTQSGIAGNTVSIGASGPAVKAAQERINVWSVQGQIAVDGLYGTGTQTAVKAFQASKHLTQDGIAGPATWAALNVDPGPAPSSTVTPAPKGLKQATASTAAAADLSWQAVPGVPLTDGYVLQLEWYKGGFGWVLSLNQVEKVLSVRLALAPRTKYRWRVAANTSEHDWTGWLEFLTN
jgi:hypothetical protein